MKNLILTFMLLTGGLTFSQDVDSVKIQEIYQKIDSVKYSELDFKKMQKYYIENRELNKLISKKASEGDHSAIKFLELMNLSYDKAIESVGKNQIKGMIYVYYQTVRMKQKFDKLNNDLDAQIDSLKLQNEYLKKKIKNDNKNIDSLKNNQRS